MDKPAETSVPIDPLLAKRWSPRALDPDRLITPDEITALLEAARWAPSCFGDEPWRFLVFDRARDPDAWQAAFDNLTEGNRKWAGNAQLLIVAVTDSVFRQNGKPNRWAQYDAGAASISLCLQATAMGLMTHQMGGFSVDGYRERFGIPESFTPMAVIAVGAMGDPATLEEGLRERELAPRKRQPLDSIAFYGKWDAG